MRKNKTNEEIKQYLLSKGAEYLNQNENDDALLFKYNDYYVLIRAYAKTNSIIVCAAKKYEASESTSTLNNSDIKMLLTNYFTKYGTISVIDGGNESASLFFYRTKVTVENASDISEEDINYLFDSIRNEINLCYAIIDNEYNVVS